MYAKVVIYFEMKNISAEKERFKYLGKADASRSVQRQSLILPVARPS